MYIHIPNVKNGQSLQLLRCIDNSRGNVEIALCEILYYPKWYNISQKLKNNRFTKNGKIVTIPDGYYNVCALNDFFKEHGCKITINSANGKLKIEVVDDSVDIVFKGLLAHTLGFVNNHLNAKINHGDLIPNLITLKEIGIHLDCINTSDNCLGPSPSSLLRMIFVGDENFNSGRFEVFPHLQYKKLKTDYIPNLILWAMDTNNQPIEMGYMSLTLHLKVCST